MVTRFNGELISDGVTELRLPEHGLKIGMARGDQAALLGNRFDRGNYLRAEPRSGVLEVYSGTSKNPVGRQKGHPRPVDWVMTIARANDPMFRFSGDERAAIEYWFCAAACRASRQGNVRCVNGVAPTDPGLPAEQVAEIRRPVLAAMQVMAALAGTQGMRDLVQAAAELLDVTAASGALTGRPRGGGSGDLLGKRFVDAGILRVGEELYTLVGRVRRSLYLRADGRVEDEHGTVFTSYTAVIDAHLELARQDGVKLSDKTRRSGPEALRVATGDYAGRDLSRLKSLLPVTPVESSDEDDRAAG